VSIVARLALSWWCLLAGCTKEPGTVQDTFQCPAPGKIVTAALVRRGSCFTGTRTVPVAIRNYHAYCAVVYWRGGWGFVRHPAQRGTVPAPEADGCPKER
jgi:hypothetical protein